SPVHQYRNLRVGEHLVGDAAENNRRNASAAVRGHHNKIAAARFGSVDDAFVGMILLDLRRFATYPGGAGLIGDRREYLSGMGFRVLGMLGKGARHCIVSRGWNGIDVK